MIRCSKLDAGACPSSGEAKGTPGPIDVAAIREEPVSCCGIHDLKPGLRTLFAANIGILRSRSAALELQYASRT